MTVRAAVRDALDALRPGRVRPPVIPRRAPRLERAAAVATAGQPCIVAVPRRMDPGSTALQLLVFYLRLHAIAGLLLAIAAIVAIAGFRSAMPVALRATGTGSRFLLGIAGMVSSMVTVWWIATLLTERRRLGGVLSGALWVLALAAVIGDRRGFVELCVAIAGLVLTVLVWKELDGTPIDE